ncbi:dihydroneopterin aldolase [Anaplasma capra]|uniref:dihydroneopterin aldolase n=1 Tax=Anaplasma capra TaxID=1562740 RepID=UPI0021D586E3|nr:dihydroneopterin aldolase [Anaplasma capra]MCU7611674.1 dihydroneopterin aldolase [Anaplasma capra]MCU7612176.1 dihydroneopterin aldolase [Anaplasma capra]
MLFKLGIVDLPVYMHVGIYSWEKVITQKVLVSVHLVYSAQHDVICYSTLSKRIKMILEEREYDLLEHAAKSLINCITKENCGVRECSAELYKPTSSYMQANKIFVAVVWQEDPSMLLDKS